MTNQVLAARASETPAVAWIVDSPRRRAWLRFRANRPAIVALGVLACLAIACYLLPVVVRVDPLAADISSIRTAPSSVHWLGTDGSGRDVLARLLYGGRVSLAVGVLAVALYVALGTLVGAIAGYAGGVPDSLLMRIVDTVMSFPPLVVILGLVSLVGPSIVNLILIIGLLGWPPVSRLVRGQFLTIRERDFVQAARITGVSDIGIVARHVLPNVVAPLLVLVTFGIGDAIMLEAGLSFLGLGVQAPDASWGQMLNGANDLGTLLLRPWMWLPPAVAIAATILAVNFMGDGLRDAFDPRADREAV